MYVQIITSTLRFTNRKRQHMIELPHAVVGAAIAAKVGNPALSLPLALASHFVLDLVPHWNPHLNREISEHGKITTRTRTIIALDVLVSLGAGFFIASTALPDTARFITIAFGAFFGVLPDVAEAPFFFLKSKNKWLERLVKFQSSLQFNVPLIPGVISQLLVLVAALWWVLGT